MHLMYYTAETGRRVYTLKKTAPDGSPTRSAHPGACSATAREAGASADGGAAVSPRVFVGRIGCAGQAGDLRPPMPAQSPHRCPLNRVHRCPLNRAAALPSPLPAARFSPDDKFSRHRVTIKKRYGLLLTQGTPLDD